MNTMMANLVDILLVEKQLDQIEEENEDVVTEEISSARQIVNMFNVKYNTDKQSVDESLASEAPP